MAGPQHSGPYKGHVVYLWEGQEPPMCSWAMYLCRQHRTDRFPRRRPATTGFRHPLEAFTLPDETILLSGHGPTTTVGEEKRGNPSPGKACGLAPFAAPEHYGGADIPCLPSAKPQTVSAPPNILLTVFPMSPTWGMAAAATAISY